MNTYTVLLSMQYCETFLLLIWFSYVLVFTCGTSCYVCICYHLPIAASFVKSQDSQAWCLEGEHHRGNAMANSKCTAWGSDLRVLVSKISFPFFSTPFFAERKTSSSTSVVMELNNLSLTPMVSTRSQKKSPDSTVIY